MRQARQRGPAQHSGVGAHQTVTMWDRGPELPSCLTFHEKIQNMSSMACASRKKRGDPNIGEGAYQSLDSPDIKMDLGSPCWLTTRGSSGTTSLPGPGVNSLQTPPTPALCGSQAQGTYSPSRPFPHGAVVRFLSPQHFLSEAEAGSSFELLA